MAAQRDSINKAAKALCELVFEGGEILPAHIEAAKRLEALAGSGGSYSKRYETHEERVLHRHLNLYRNKLETATTQAQRLHWASKIAEQQDKIAEFKGGGSDLDLDGL